LSKGTGAPLSNPSEPLTFPRNINRVSGPDSGSCAACHNRPRVGGGGDVVDNVFVMAQRLDFVTLSSAGADVGHHEGSRAESIVGNVRKTVGMFGAGYVEMLARQITGDLQRQRDSIGPGQQVGLHSKGISFGRLSRTEDGQWNVANIEGLPSQSLRTTGPAN